MRYMHLMICLLLALVASAGCQREPTVEEGAVVSDDELAGPASGGAVSTAPVETDPVPPAADASPQSPTEPGVIDWASLELAPGTVSVSCGLDYPEQGDGEPMTDFSAGGLRLALAPCVEHSVTRIRYRGRIDSGFAALVERLTATADELRIDKRVLDLDSAGGQVEDAIRAGDLIAESRWTIWVREGSLCHSACVLILSAGDTRMIAGQVGIHRIIRMSSTATTRAELNEELHVVYQRVRDYLERNGAAVAVADLMRAVPNRSLRLLSSAELQLYGLDGVNAAQDDLDRLRLMRKCGEDFVRRRDAFVRAFDRRCKTPDSMVDAINDCGRELRGEYDFPDGTCPSESPFSEFDSMAAPNEPADGDGDNDPASESTQ